MDAGEPTLCSSCGSSIGAIPNPPPEISSVDSSSTARDIISEAEQRIADLEEMERRSLNNHQSILRRLEEYRRFVSYQKTIMVPVHRLPSELLSEIFVTCVADSNFNKAIIVSHLPWVLGKVCRPWRDIVLTTPRLWNRLPRIYAIRDFFATDHSLVQTSFTLAKGLPLSIDVYIDQAFIASNPLLNTLVSHSDRIGDLAIDYRGDSLRLLSGIHSRLQNLRTLKLTTANRSDTPTAIFSIAPQLREFCFTSSISLDGLQFFKLDLPWSQLKTVTIRMLDIYYAFMVLSEALQMEICTFMEIVNIGEPHEIIQHMDLKELSLEGPRNVYNAFPTALSDVLVLPNLISLLVKFDKLTISPILSLITRSDCRLTKLVLNGPIIEGSLMTLLEETPSLIHLEVHALLPADIKGLTVDKKNGNQPITPHLRVISITNSDDIAHPLSINTLIRSRVDPEIPHLEPIQELHIQFKVPSHANMIYAQLRNFPWMPECTGSEYREAVKWAKALRNVIPRLPPKNKDISMLNGILGQIERWGTFKQPFLATSELYENLVYISSQLDGENVLLNPLQERIRLLLNSWTLLKEEYGKFPQGNWKQKMSVDSSDQSSSRISYFAPGK